MSDLTHEDIETYLYRIFTGAEYAYIGGVLMCFKHPSNQVKQRAVLIYKKAYNDALAQGLLPVKELEELVEKRGLITERDKLTLKKLEGQLLAQEVLLSKTTRVKANQERIKNNILSLKKKIHEITFKKQSKLTLSAETKAEEIRTFFLCSQCSYTEGGNLYWSSYEAALNETDILKKDSILIGFLNFFNGITVRVIREIARSNLWRIRYVNSQKTSDPLFGIPSSDYNSDQLNLVYWSNYYQNIYEMLPEDRPSDSVIEDDDTLDAYMKAFYEERTREDASRRSKAKTPGRLSAFDSEEVIITRSHDLYEDIEYDTPREAQKIKNRVDLKKRTKRG